MGMFVNRDEEDRFVVALHFPVTHGRARQVKIVAAIREFVREDANGTLRVDTEREFDDQALADFEQICVNFITAALPVLRKSANLLSRLMPDRAIPNELEPGGIFAGDDDHFKEYIVNVPGWPRARPRFRLHDVVRLYPGHVTRDVEAGYLVPVDDLGPNDIAEGTLFGKIIADYRKSRARDLAARRPSPTNAEKILATSEGRKVREDIVKAFADIADQMFPSSPGRPLARTIMEEMALADEIQNDFNRRKATYVSRGIRKTRRAIFDEMAAGSTYGNHVSLSASTIERFMSMKPRGNPQK